MIDLHSHILPGLDDGARDLDDALAIARDAVADGITAIAATPHVRSDYRTTREQISHGVDELREALARAEIALDVIPGAEIAFDEVDALLEGDDLKSFALAGRVLLIEPPYFGWPIGFADVMSRVRLRGLVPLVAHPERNGDVQRDVGLIADLMAAGALIQVTAASVDGRLGRSARASAERLVDLGYVHVIASDAHSPGLRAVGLSDARAALGNDGLGRWLTADVPAALLAGDPFPPRPQRPPRVERPRLGRPFRR